MQVDLPKYDVGVIIARFQVPDLHTAHIELIEHVAREHDKVLVLLGLAPIPVATANPLDFEARKQMILDKFPNVNVLYVKDMHDDKLWSKKVDEVVTDVLTPGQTAVLYGGRDSFISHYQGRFSTRELTQTQFYSGSAQRKAIARSRTRGTQDFRAGVIWASSARFPTCFTTVDVAVLNEDSTRVLLGRKPNEALYRFLGGFSDPRSPDFETDARREVSEEAGIEVGDVTYLGSAVVDDWRYRNEPDCIKTLMFRAKYLHGRPTPGDDIEEVRWFDLPVQPSQILEVHRPLMAMLNDNLKGA